MDNECDLVILVIIIYLYIILYYTFLPFIPNIPFNHPALLYFTSPHLCTVPSLSYTHPLSCFLSPSATDQGEAICSSNPSLILTQRSWKMYSRQTVGRCRLALGPQQEPGPALMEHYFHPLHPTIPPLPIYVSSLLPFVFFVIFIILSYSKTEYIHLSIYLFIYPSIYLSMHFYLWKCFSPRSPEFDETKAINIRGLGGILAAQTTQTQLSAIWTTLCVCVCA